MFKGTKYISYNVFFVLVSVKLCKLKASFKETQSQCVCGYAYLDPSMPLCMCQTFLFALCVPPANIRKFPKRRVNSEFTGLAHNLALLIILPGHDLSEPTEPFLVLCTFCWVLSTWYYKKSILHLSSIILVFQYCCY